MRSEDNAYFAEISKKCTQINGNVEYIFLLTPHYYHLTHNILLFAIYYHASGFVCSFRQIFGHSKLQLNIIFPFLAYCAFALPTRPPLCQIIQSIVQLALLSLLVTPVRVYLHIFRILCEL